MKYCTKEDVENYLLTDIHISFDGQIDDWIEAASEHINRLTGRVFAIEEPLSDEDHEARLYDCGKTHTLFIDDCVEIIKVEIGDLYGDSFTETTDYVALPLNDIPKNAIALKHQQWPRGVHRISARWGYSEEPPADIRFAAIVIAAGIVNAHVKVGTAKKSEHIGNYSVEYSDDKGINDWERVQDILRTYRKYVL